ncbi:hypothetical protein [Paraburkholderia sp. BR13444]|uniref:hypothetical protein n=1 Tax=Paraburkholderia sp. BR13444 TaxID=3236997 RepID=UPI0034CDE509
MDSHAFPDARQTVARALVAHIKDDECVVWPSALKIAYRAGVSEATAQRVLTEFDRKGLTVRLPDFVIPPDPKNPKPKKQIARRVDMHRLHELYPENIDWDEYLVGGRAKQQRFAAKRITASEVSDYRMNNGGLPHRTPRITSPCGTSVLERLQERSIERFKTSNDGTARVSQRAATAAGEPSTDLRSECVNGAQTAEAVRCKTRTVQPHESEEETTFEGIVAQCVVRGRDDPQKDWSDRQRQGATLEDLRAAFVQAAGKSKGPAPHWSAIDYALGVIVQERASVVGGAHSHKYSKEEIAAAQAREAILFRHIDRPSWSATHTRLDIGTWLVLNRDVDEALFEAACLDAVEKAQSTGKAPTWHLVGSALYARMKAQKSNAQQQEAAGKRLFNRPAAAGSFSHAGNETRH